MWIRHCEFHKVFWCKQFSSSITGMRGKHLQCTLTLLRQCSLKCRFVSFCRFLGASLFEYARKKESAKLHALRNLVPYVPSCRTFLVPYVLSCLTCLVPYALSCPTCLVPYVPLCLTCLVPYMLSCLKCLVPYVLSCSRALCASCFTCPCA